MAGPRQGVPPRVFAPQRGAVAGSPDGLPFLRGCTVYRFRARGAWGSIRLFTLQVHPRRQSEYHRTSDLFPLLSPCVRTTCFRLTSVQSLQLRGSAPAPAENGPDPNLESGTTCGGRSPSGRRKPCRPKPRPRFCRPLLCHRKSLFLNACCEPSRFLWQFHGSDPCRTPLESGHSGGRMRIARLIGFSVAPTSSARIFSASTE